MTRWVMSLNIYCNLRASINIIDLCQCVGVLMRNLLLMLNIYTRIHLILDEARGVVRGMISDAGNAAGRINLPEKLICYVSFLPNYESKPFSNI